MIFIFYKVLIAVVVNLLYAGQDSGKVQSHLIGNHMSCHPQRIKQNAVHPPGLRDAIIIPEATLAAVTVSVN